VTNWKLILEYDGSDFAGWQRQPGARRTVQGALEEAFARVSGDAVAVHGAGRTDAGVHAEAQVANAQLATRLDAPALHAALNAVLPRDVAVRELAVAPAGFHARRDARSKRYVYRLWTAPVRSPLRDRRSLWVRRPHDLTAMREAASLLVGRRDFATFQAAGSSVRSTVRWLERVEIEGSWGGAVEIAFEADGFLRHMVRNMVGTLLEVGRRRRTPRSIVALLAGRDRTCAGPTVPARGLTLASVRYGDFPAESEGLDEIAG